MVVGGIDAPGYTSRIRRIASHDFNPILHREDIGHVIIHVTFGVDNDKVWCLGIGLSKVGMRVGYTYVRIGKKRGSVKQANGIHSSHICCSPRFMK